MECNQLDRLIEDLDNSVSSAEPFKTKWKDIWDRIKKIGAAFKETRFAKKEEREERWQHFQSLVDKVKEIQAEEREKWDERSAVSKHHKGEIIAFAERAIPTGPLSDLVFTIVSLPALPVKAALDAILPGGELDEKHEQLKACSRKLQEGWKLFADYKDEMMGRDKKEAFQALKDAQESLNGEWDRWKETKSNAKQARDEYFRSKREAYIDKVKDRIANHKERLEKLYAALERRESHLEELKDKRDSARTDEFRELVEGWIEEEENRIENIKEKIERIEGWLEEDQNRLK